MIQLSTFTQSTNKVEIISFTLISLQRFLIIFCARMIFDVPLIQKTNLKKIKRKKNE